MPLAGWLLIEAKGDLFGMLGRARFLRGPWKSFGLVGAYWVSYKGGRPLLRNMVSMFW
ncbi:MAG: hypothetical protein Ct9H300mP11_04470 [Chloroflexota bacterium]|nr:MAG: hypothetical protein Ct9H300mP11_04470 [Chloroflexota bacterium]